MELLELMGAAVSGRVGGGSPSGSSMLFSGLASFLWNHSFHLGLVLYLKCPLPFGELSCLCFKIIIIIIICFLVEIHSLNP